jgi:hypothetical protein
MLESHHEKVRPGGFSVLCFRRSGFCLETQGESSEGDSPDKPVFEASEPQGSPRPPQKNLALADAIRRARPVQFILSLNPTIDS